MQFFLLCTEKSSRNSQCQATAQHFGEKAQFFLFVVSVLSSTWAQRGDPRTTDSSTVCLAEFGTGLMRNISIQIKSVIRAAHTAARNLIIKATFTWLSSSVKPQIHWPYSDFPFLCQREEAELCGLNENKVQLYKTTEPHKALSWKGPWRSSGSNPSAMVFIFVPPPPQQLVMSE